MTVTDVTVTRRLDDRGRECATGRAERGPVTVSVTAVFGERRTEFVVEVGAGEVTERSKPYPGQMLMPTLRDHEAAVFTAAFHLATDALAALAADSVGEEGRTLAFLGMIEEEIAPVITDGQSLLRYAAGADDGRVYRVIRRADGDLTIEMDAPRWG